MSNLDDTVEGQIILEWDDSEKTRLKKKWYLSIEERTKKEDIYKLSRKEIDNWLICLSHSLPSHQISGSLAISRLTNDYAFSHERTDITILTDYPEETLTKFKGEWLINNNYQLMRVRQKVLKRKSPILFVQYHPTTPEEALASNDEIELIKLDKKTNTISSGSPTDHIRLKIMEKHGNTVRYKIGEQEISRPIDYFKCPKIRVYKARGLNFIDFLHIMDPRFIYETMEFEHRKGILTREQIHQYARLKKFLRDHQIKYPIG